MSLKVNTRCAFCKETLDYLDTDTNKVFRSTHDHDDQACKDYLYNTVAHLQQRVADLTKRWEDDQYRAKAKDLQAYNKIHRLNNRIEELGTTLAKAPADQKAKLIDQCHRWQALYERERHKRWALKKQIMHVYGTLDFWLETGCIVDQKAKVVAEYVSDKLRELLRKTGR
jgi:hypothetical protein